MKVRYVIWFSLAILMLALLPSTGICKYDHNDSSSEMKPLIAERIWLQDDELFAWAKGHTTIYKINVYPSGAICQFRYETGDNSAGLTIEEYLYEDEYYFQISGQEVGTIPLTITEINSGQSISVLVHLVNEVISAEVDNSPIFLITDSDQTIPVTITLQNGITTHQLVGVYFSSNNSAIATVDYVGRVKGVSPGETSITVTVSEGNPQHGITMPWVTIPVVVLDKDKALILPKDLKVIDPEAFAGTGIESVFLSDACEKIGEKAFANCTNLRYVRIVSDTLDIAEDAFDNCSNVFVDRKRRN